MGQTTPLDLLRKWHVNQTTVIVSGSDKRQGKLVEHRAKVVFPDRSRAILTTVGASPQTKAIDLMKVNLSIPDGVKGIKVEWPSKENTLIREE